MADEDIAKQQPEALVEESLSRQHVQSPVNPKPESANTIETKLERTEALLLELVKLIRRANEPSEPPLTPWTKTKKAFQIHHRSH